MSGGGEPRAVMSLDELLVLWDRVDDACDRVACALPAQMTDAASRLERSRKDFRAGIRRYTLATGLPPAPETAEVGHG